MKKTGIIFLLIILLTSTALAIDCPKGLVNDTYPGECGLYTDSNKDKICDYSQELTLNSPIQSQSLSNKYYFWQISIIATIIYLISHFIIGKKDIVLHKKIWNILLLITFIATALTSILFLFQINTGFNNTFWHIELGLIMILISAYHTLWHIPYLKAILRI